MRLDEIEAIVRAQHGEFELTRIAEAPEYRKTLAILEDERRNADVPGYGSGHSASK